MNRPIRLPILRACAVLWLAPAALCPGQAPAESSRETAKPLSARDPLPEFPVNGLLDEGNVFRADEVVLLTSDVEDFRTRLGFPLYVVTANYILGDTVQNYGDRLVKEGLRGRDGMVILFERASGKLHYSSSPGLLGRVEDMQALFRVASRAGAAMPEEASPAQRLRGVVQALTSAAAQWKQTGKPPVPAEEPVPQPEPAKPEKALEPPSDFVMDGGDIFDAEAEEALKAELAKFHADHQMDVYVLTSTFLNKQTAQTLAENLAGEWLPERCGAVVVMNRGTGAEENSLGIGLAPNDELVVPAGTLFKALAAARAKSEEVRNSPGGSTGAAVHAAARIIMNTLARPGEAALAKQAKGAATGQWSVTTSATAALLAGAALLFVFHRIKERLETRSNEQFRFPDVTVGRRLGAVQGGGSVAGISFGRKP